MTTQNVELKVGFLVLIGAAILIFAVWLAGGLRYGQEFYPVTIMFPEVGALSSGDPVAVSGVNKGKVKKIGLHEGNVMVTLDMASDVVLKEDASFVVKNIGLMGERYVAVKTGKSPNRLDVTAPAAGEFDAGIPEVMGMMGDVIRSMDHLVGLLRETVISPATLDKFSETIDNMQKITARFEKATETNVPKVDSAVDNFARLADALKKGLDRNQSYIDTAAQNFDAASRRLLKLVADMEDASAKFKSFATDLDESEGSLRMLMEDRRLYDDMRRTAQNIDSLVMDIRQDPRKYINFTMELF
jgi:phospholipid/cholesterol/gamma-HCH transport system substrate-binding protein